MAMMTTKAWPIKHHDLVDLLEKLEEHELFEKRFDSYSQVDTKSIADHILGVITFDELISKLTTGTGTHWRKDNDAVGDSDLDNNTEEVEARQISPRATRRQ